VSARGPTCIVRWNDTECATGGKLRKAIRVNTRVVNSLTAKEIEVGMLPSIASGSHRFPTCSKGAFAATGDPSFQPRLLCLGASHIVVRDGGGEVDGRSRSRIVAGRPSSPARKSPSRSWRSSHPPRSESFRLACVARKTFPSCFVLRGWSSSSVFAILRKGPRKPDKRGMPLQVFGVARRYGVLGGLIESDEVLALGAPLESGGAELLRKARTSAA